MCLNVQLQTKFVCTLKQELKLMGSDSAFL